MMKNKFEDVKYIQSQPLSLMESDRNSSSTSTGSEGFGDEQRYA